MREIEVKIYMNYLQLESDKVETLNERRIICYHEKGIKKNCEADRIHSIPSLGKEGIMMKKKGKEI